MMRVCSIGRPGFLCPWRKQRVGNGGGVLRRELLVPRIPVGTPPLRRHNGTPRGAGGMNNAPALASWLGCCSRELQNMGS